jgi:uncharacterized protein
MNIQALDLAQEEVVDLCQRYHIRRLAMVGTILSDNSRATSNINVLVEFEPGHVPGLSLVKIPNELSSLFGGCPVDMVAPNFFNERMREHVLSGAEDIYLQGQVGKTQLSGVPQSVKMMVVGDESAPDGDR